VAMQTRAPGRRVALIFTKSTTTRDSGCEVHWTRALSWKPSRNLPCWAPLLAARTARRTGARAGAEAGRQNRATAELRAVKLEAVADMMEVCLGGQRVVIEGCIRDLRCCSALASVCHIMLHVPWTFSFALLLPRRGQCSPSSSLRGL